MLRLFERSSVTGDQIHSVGRSNPAPSVGHMALYECDWMLAGDWRRRLIGWQNSGVDLTEIQPVL